MQPFRRMHTSANHSTCSHVEPNVAHQQRDWRHTFTSCIMRHFGTQSINTMSFVINYKSSKCRPSIGAPGEYVYADDEHRCTDGVWCVCMSVCFCSRLLTLIARIHMHSARVLRRPARWRTCAFNLLGARRSLRAADAADASAAAISLPAYVHNTLSHQRNTNIRRAYIFFTLRTHITGLEWSAHMYVSKGCAATKPSRAQRESGHKEIRNPCSSSAHCKAHAHMCR